MMRAVPPDQDERIRAVTTFDRNVVVVAGAGTGKTTLLVDRLLHLLLGRGVEAERIVAVTFTEKAANEMRLRLEARLRDALAALGGGRDAEWQERVADLRERYHLSSEKLLERVRAAFDSLPLATIGTLHSLAAQILRDRPMEAGVAPRFEVDAGDPAEQHARLFEEEWERWIEGELGEQPPRAKQWEAALETFDLATLRELAMRLSKPLATGALLAGWFALNRIPEEMKKWIAELRATVASFDGKRGSLPEQRDASLRVLDAMGAGKHPASEPALEKNAGTSKGWESVTEAVEGVQKLYEADDATVAAAIEVVRPFVEMLRERYRKAGFVSFDGLIDSARTLLQRNQPARTEMKRRWKALLVDEFQDTDPVQQEILVFLAEEPDAFALDASQVRLEPGKLFVVGDPKQSIYRFRGADVEVFTGVQEQVLAQGGTRVDLTTNFRSHSGVLGVVNEAFSRLLAKRRYQAEYVRIEAEPGREPKLPSQKVELWRVQADNAEAAREVEAREIARFLSAQVGEMPLSPDAKLQYRDAAILFRSMSQVHVYLEALREEGVPYVVEGERHFFETEEVLELLNLLTAIADPSDRIALLGVLRSPLFGLTDAEVCTLAGQDALDWRGKGLTAASQRAYETLQGLARKARELSPPALVDAILEQTPLLDLLAEGHHGEQRTANLWKVRQLVESASRGLGGDLCAVVEALRRRAEEEPREGESPLADETLDAVRVMSIHKAKGLEFGVVFVAGLGAEGRGRNPAVQVWVDERLRVAGMRLAGVSTRAGAWLLQEERRREREEEKRVLYVAMTRARERLVLSGQPGKKWGMGLLADAFGGEASTVCGELKLGEAVIECRDVVESGERREPRAPKERGVKRTEWNTYAERWRARESVCAEVQGRRLQATPSMLDAAEEAPSIRTGQSVSQGQAALVGTLCHRVLAQWRFGGANANALERAVHAAAESVEGKREEVDRARGEAKEVLQTFLASAAGRRLEKAEVLAREQPFVLREEDGTIVTGTVDLICRIDGRVVVADWKTDRVEKRDLAKAAARHENQRRLYCRAVEQGGWGKDIRFELIYLRPCEVIVAE